MSDVIAPAKDGATGRFLPGNNGGTGRPKGSRNKLGELFVQAMHEDFMANGTETIKKVREESPEQYLKVIASILPKQIELDGTALGQFTDEQLAQLVVTLDAWVEANSPPRGPETPGRDEARPVPTLQ